ncbi:hypothetical protein F5148DRAFT_1166497 [Russula earlei]|uniref:Uncharacterized protein n=2 Tax=Russula earlei TaxID=71964 RepID=A0ACC0UH15_9AGAM|nr:hypothetical protein F5148DRAFT_1180270 [Russula earlei]KAI9511957.1 hypothetical protein F5148DRAFT_1166497 [Russula earlei]
MLGYRRLPSHCDKLFGDLRTLMESLHSDGLVHGDLRDPDVVCEEEMMALDFDWGRHHAGLSSPAG